MVKKFLLKLLVVCSLIAFCVSCTSTSSNQVDLKLIPVKSGEKWGYINKKGEYVINPQFQQAKMFRDGLALVQSSNGKWGFVDKNGKYEIPAQYKSATPFIDGLAWVVLDGGYPTCIDKAGKTRFIFKEAKYVVTFSEGLAMFALKDKEDNIKVGFVDKSGKVIINAQFDSASPFSEGLARIEKKGKWGFIDKTGKIVINPQFEKVSDFKNGKAVFENGKQWGYIDSKGTYVINPQFEAAGHFKEGMALILQGKEFGYINEDGKIEINPQFDYAGDFSSGMAVIVQNDKYGYIDKKGKIQINPQFDDASQFYDDIAFVESGDQWGIINKKGKYLVNPQFNLMYKNVGEWFYVVSDYYDASEFVNNFFQKANDNAFDGFTGSSTLQDIVDNSLYDNVYADDKYIVYTNDDQTITDEISITKTQFYFTNPIYETVTTYSDYWGYRYETGKSKKYHFDEKVAVIEYQFYLSGEADEKGGAIAHTLKTEIERRFNVKMESKSGQYFVFQDDKLSFCITYTDYLLSLYIGFDSGELRNILINKIEEDDD